MCEILNPVKEEDEAHRWINVLESRHLVFAKSQPVVIYEIHEIR